MSEPAIAGQDFVPGRDLARGMIKKGEMGMKNKRGWIGIICLLVVGVWLISGCVSIADHQRAMRQKDAELQNLKTQKDKLADAKKNLESINQKLAMDLAMVQANNQKIEAELQAKKIALGQLESDLAKRLAGIPGTTLVPGVGLEIQGEILFDPGLAELKEQGHETLDKIAEAINKSPEYIIHIEGHTDTDPIVHHKDLWTTGSNFELAAYRALKILLYLQDAGVDPARMYLCSFGEHRPKVVNDSSANKSQNRRVVIGFQKITPKPEAPEKETPEKGGAEEGGEMRK